MPSIDYAAELEHPDLRGLPGATQAAREIRACRYPFPAEAIDLCNALDVWVMADRPRERAPFGRVIHDGPKHPMEHVVAGLLRLYTVRIFAGIMG